MRFLLFATIIVSITVLLSAQDGGRGGQPAGRAAPAPAMTLTIPGCIGEANAVSPGG
jgi:hypothetical protein